MKTTQRGIVPTATILLILLSVALGLKAQTTLDPVNPTNVPTDGGTFFLMSDYLSNNGSLGAPYPFLKDTNDAVYSLNGSCFIVADVSFTNDDELENALSLLAQPQDAFSAALMGGTMSSSGMVMAMDPGSDSPMFGGYAFDTTSLWLEITNVFDGIAYLNLHNATNQVYAIWSTTNLPGGWNVESEVWPTNSDVMPFTELTLDRQNLFLLAEDWTGVTENGNTVPDWWFWMNFGTTALFDTNLDSGGNTFLMDYTNGIDPNVIQFSLQFTNTWFNTTTAHGSVVVSGGIPFYVATLVNDTNTADASWQPYSGTNVAVSLPASNGTYTVQVGLRGLSTNTVQSWLPILLTLRTNPPTLVFTNPPSPTVTAPMIQLQGAADEPLNQLTFAVSNALGVITNQTGYVVDQFYDTNQLAFTSNYFQCYDINVTNGLNTITLQATDPAGNTTNRNISITLDYSGATPPVLSVVWPQNGTLISGNSFTFQGLVNDRTAIVMAQIVDTNGDTSTVQGLVERNGKIFVNNLPMSAGTNILTVATTNAAGLSTITNLTLIQSSVTITVDPLSSDQANQSAVSVTGTISDPSGDVCIQVNGTNAYYLDDLGDWEADNVPVSPAGTATFDVELYTNDPVNIGSQIVTPPQPATVTVMTMANNWNSSYVDITPRDEENNYYTSYLNWSYASGGSTFGYSSGQDGGSYFSGNFNTPIPAGVGALSFVAQNGYMAGTVYSFTIQTNYFDLPYAYYASYSYQAHTEMMIVPPDQQAPGGTASYLVLSSAMTYTNIDDATSGNPGEVPVPPTEIYVNGQQLLNTGITNADGSVSGMTLVSGPSGAPVRLTTTADLASTAYQLQPLTLRIIATNNNMDVTDQTNTVIVGEQINLLCRLSLTNQYVVTNYPPSDFQWTVPGYAISNYVVAPDSSSAMVVNSFPLNSSNVAFYWAGGASNLKVQCSATVHGTPLTAEATFNIVRPTASITTRTRSVELGYNIGLTHYAICFGAHGDSPGILFSNAITMPQGDYNSGNTNYALEWVQVIAPNYLATQTFTNYLETQTFTNSDPHTYSQSATNVVLDTFYPYPFSPAFPYPDADDSPFITIDFPTEIAASVSQSSEMWLMFQPANGNWVPLQTVNWSWSGAATNSGTGWVLTSTNWSANPTGVDAGTTYPVWTNNVTNIPFQLNP